MTNTNLLSTIPQLYVNEQDGRICCADHVGTYARSAITNAPDASHWDTPLGVWSRWTTVDMARWIAEIGTPATCECC